jgi:hypothetical protein
MNFLQKVKYNQNWNIGFCEQTPEELVQNKILKPIQWMKHPYNDRWFADPFILKVAEDEVVVFVEECPIEKPKGIICELVLDKHTKRLKQRYVLLELDTHLSYPAIIKHNGKKYVYPENGASGKLNIYEYDELKHQLVNPVCILDEAVADATIIEHQGRYLMVATKYPKTQEGAFLYHSDSLFGPFVQMYEKPIQSNLSCSRPGGNWLAIGNQLFRPSQDCVKRYGSALSIMEIDMERSNWEEKEVTHILPMSHRYNLGLHTINYSDGICVVDGYGYYYFLLGRVYYSPFLRSLFEIDNK